MLGDDGAERRIPAARLMPGQRFVVRPGETIAADGEVLFGQSAVDRSMMTGESVPVEAFTGDGVTAGTVAVSGRLIVRADRVGDDTQLAHLVALVEQAQGQKAAIQRVADRVCGVFVPAVLTLAVGAAMAASSTFVVGNSVRLRRSGTPAAIRSKRGPGLTGRRETRVLAGPSQESR